MEVNDSSLLTPKGTGIFFFRLLLVNMKKMLVLALTLKGNNHFFLPAPYRLGQNGRKKGCVKLFR
jgi:hypothetical protein